MHSDFTWQFHSSLSARTRSYMQTVYQACIKTDEYALSSGFNDTDDEADAYLLVTHQKTQAPCAYAAVYELDDSLLIYAFVHPAFRRQGFFTDMCALLQKRCPDRRLDFSADEKSPAVRHMLLTGRIVCQEKQLLLTCPVKRGHISGPMDISIKASDDRALLCALHEKIFPDFPDEARMSYIGQMLHSEEMQAYIFTAADDFDTSKRFLCGMGFLLRGQTSACLCGFGIVPSFRNKGYGLACLRLICDMLADDAAIRQLQVQTDAKNTAAVRLYKRFGFQECDVFASYTYIGK